MTEELPGFRLIVRVFHLVWAIPGLVVSYIFATATGGHPPGILFLPVVLIVWGVGHLAIWGASRVARKAGAKRGQRTTWPISIIIAVASTGIVAFAGLFLVVAGLITGEGLSNQIQYAVLILAWIGHTAAFLGLLARQPWGRYLAAAAATVWLLVLLTQITDHLVHGRPVDLLELAVVVG
ncbi:MAG: hypothetical protein HKN37_09720, partial [Rhodothermales bacterium]|nr:hypothetical protein [Rhodothermales bacterium]